MRKYKIEINGIYLFIVNGKSQAEVIRDFCPPIKNLYYENNMPLVSLGVSHTKLESKTRTLQEIIDKLKSEWSEE